jgi:hypothetical protein
MGEPDAAASQVGVGSNESHTDIETARPGSRVVQVSLALQKQADASTIRTSGLGYPSDARGI